MIVDLLLLAILALRAFRGYRRGLIATLVSLGGRIAAVFLAMLLASPISRLVAALIETPADETPILGNFAAGAKETVAYGIVFAVLLLLFLIAAKVLTSLAKKFNKIPVLGKVNRILGLSLGIFEGLLFTWAICTVLALFPDGTLVSASDTFFLRFFATINPVTFIVDALLSA